VDLGQREVPEGEPHRVADLSFDGLDLMARGVAARDQSHGGL
jgi:hypothetical protein